MSEGGGGRGVREYTPEFNQTQIKMVQSLHLSSRDGSQKHLFL